MYSDQKLKLFRLLDYLMENTDEEHTVSMKQILHYLDSYGIHAERKSIYNDIEILRDYGVDVISVKGRGSFGYYIGERDFELAELKLLVDAIQAAKFITTKKSSELIKKLESHTSKYQAVKLQRNVYVAERVKTINESIYYNVDSLYEAMHDNKIIEFKYLEWNLDKKLVPKNNGAVYRVSPWQLIWNDGNYYLVAYDEMSGRIKHYRVDKMSGINICEENRNGKDVLKNINPAIYENKNFSMFGGEEEKVVLEADNRLIGVIIDRFGKDIPVIRDGHVFRTHVDVVVSGQFFGWICGLGGEVKIVEPEKTKKEYADYLQKLINKGKS